MAERNTSKNKQIKEKCFVLCVCEEQGPKEQIQSLSRFFFRCCQPTRKREFTGDHKFLCSKQQPKKTEVSRDYNRSEKFFFSLAVGPLFTCEPNRQQIHRSDRQLERKSEKGKDQSAKRFFFFSSFKFFILSISILKFDKRNVRAGHWPIPSIGATFLSANNIC